jgi:hypothetical protein
MGKCQTRITTVFQRQNVKCTICRLTIGIDHPWALVGTFLLVVKGAISPMMECLDAVTHL